MNALPRRIGEGVASLFARMRGEERIVSWRGRAEQAGLTDIAVGTRFPYSDFLTGRRGRHALQIERFSESRSNKGVRVVIDGLSDSVGLQGEGFGTAIAKALGSRDVETGDALFDESFFLSGDPVVLHALLDAETRRMARDLFAGRLTTEPSGPRRVEMAVRVAYGTLKAEFRDRWGAQDLEPVPGTLLALLALAERLAPPGRLEERLAAIVRSDPVARVRSHALTVLARDHPRASATREALAAALGDADMEVRLFAALTDPEAGRRVLEAFATSKDAEDWCSARAIEGLGDRLTLDVGRRALEAARAGSKQKTALVALLPVARAGGVDAVMGALRHPSHAVATVAARALGAVSAPGAEDALIEALGRDSIDVRFAAAQALGVLGTARAVLPLKDLERRGRYGVDKAAREAIARIQARLTGATPGQLSVADDASGHVSLGDDASGRVTLPPED